LKEPDVCRCESGDSDDEEEDEEDDEDEPPVDAPPPPNEYPTLEVIRFSTPWPCRPICPSPDWW